ncbi:MAG: glycosyltransferase family 9 protein [Candidatus Eremiobacteraeota bacterium]|nr:glycosyltransferase family 9 protein [Candidatus Eremiobacteraeota bacterium]
MSTQHTSTRCRRRCAIANREREAILLVRLDGIGDAALCVPALEGMRRAFPGAMFGAVCSPSNATLFSERVENIHVYEASGALDGVCEDVQAQRYTRALIATEEVVGYELARCSGAPRRAGFWHGLQKPFKSMWQRAQVSDAVYRPAAWTKRPEHEVATMYRLASALGASPPVPDSPQDLAAWLRVEDSLTAQKVSDALAFQVTPKLLAGGWGPTSLARLVTVALDRSGCSHAVLIASRNEESLACSLLEHVPGALRDNGSISMISSLTVPRWLGVLARVSALVTPDTGAAHVAGMQGVAVIDLFDEDGFERLSQQWHPWAGAWRCLPKPAWRAGLETSFGTQVGDAVRAVRKA